MRLPQTPPPLRAESSTDGSRKADSRGAVTAEFAVALPAVLLLLALLLAGSAAGVTQLGWRRLPLPAPGPLPAARTRPRWK